MNGPTGKRDSADGITSNDVSLQVNSDKKIDSTITIGTIARALEGIARGEQNPIAYGADHYKDTFKFGPITEQGKKERAEQIKAKETPLTESLKGAADVLTKPVNLVDCLNENNQYVVPTKFNGQDALLIISPSSITSSMDVEIEGEGSKNVNLSMKALIAGLTNLFPIRIEQL